MTSFAKRVQATPKQSQVDLGEMISLGGGYAFPAMLPDIGEVAASVARRLRVESLQYGPHMGVPELRDEIVRLLAEDGVVTARENILVLNGAKNGLDLALRLYVEPGDTVVVTRPNYATALHIFRNHQAVLVEIGMDERGLRTDELEQTLAERRARGEAMPKLLYVVPDFHNPTGITLAEERRRRLVGLAETFDFMIVEDDPYRRINFSGEFLPPIQAFDRAGRVIGLGTVSKIFAPGIRIGWANATAEIVRAMTTLKSDGGTSPFTQLIVAEMMRSGAVADHARALSRELRTHRDAMVAALGRHLPDARFEVPHGGYYLWLRLPEGIDADALTVAAEEGGVSIFSGRAYFADRRPNDFVRLCFSNCTPDEIERGVARLGDIVHRLHNVRSGGAPRGRATKSAQAQHLD